MEGEDPFEVTSENIQLRAIVQKNPSGEFSSPRAPGGPEPPKFIIPAETNLTSMEEEAEIVAMTNQQNPYDGIRGSNRDGMQTNMQGAVATFEVRNRGGTPKDIRINPSETLPIQFKIPLVLRASACRRTQGGCRYWDESKGEWSSDGLVEVGALCLLRLQLPRGYGELGMGGAKPEGRGKGGTGLACLRASKHRSQLGMPLARRLNEGRATSCARRLTCLSLASARTMSFQSSTS